jgi:hypothetical protein
MRSQSRLKDIFLRRRLEMRGGAELWSQTTARSTGPGIMIRKVARYVKALRSMEQINFALSRGTAASMLRNVDLTDPLSWEFSGFSQNGEDGILEVLCKQILDPTRYFVEVGASDGVENNTAWLAVSRKYSGLWIEGNPELSGWSEYLFARLNYGLEFSCLFVDRENGFKLKEHLVRPNPDVFSIDIDGNDYYIAEAVLKAGVRPKIFTIEYNSAYGPTESLTIPYRREFRLTGSPGDNLYYGCAIAALRRLFADFGYRFLTVEANGVNAFFIDPGEFDPAFVRGVSGAEFVENFSQRREYKSAWHSQFELIRHREFVSI